MMSRFFYMLVALVVSTPVIASQLPDLSGATYVQHGECLLNNEEVTCLEVEKSGTKYVVFYKNVTILAIYRVKAGATNPYFPEDMEAVYPLPGTSI